MTGLVRLERDGAVGVIRLDRPPLNAINSAIHRELLEVARQVAGNPEIRAVVLYGGERAFAAGADIKEMVDRTPGEIPGGGLELRLAADFRIVAENALLGLPEITLGVIPGGGATRRLPRLIGVTKAKEMIFTGRPVDGAQAVDIGLASR